MSDTKAQLTATVAALRAELDRQENTPIVRDVGDVYVAFADPGQPVCYVGNLEDAGMSINIYRAEEGHVIGVMVYNVDAELVASVGYVPVELARA